MTLNVKQKVGENQGAVTGIDARQARLERHIGNYFDLNFGVIREALGDMPDEVMHELTRFVYELSTKIALMELRMAKLERDSNIRLAIFLLVLVLVVLMFWKLFFGHVEVMA